MKAGQPTNRLRRQVVVVNELGIHARSAAKIAAVAQQAAADIWIEKDGETVDAKSIIDILSLACTQGTRIAIAVAEAADLPTLNKVHQLIADGCGE